MIVICCSIEFFICLYCFVAFPFFVSNLLYTCSTVEWYRFVSFLAFSDSFINHPLVLLILSFEGYFLENAKCFLSWDGDC